MNMDEPGLRGPLWTKWSVSLVFSHPLSYGTQQFEAAVEVT